ncbi:MAG: sugar phosphate isomerase/epimerase family protein [Verrucomicrobiota bacterium]|nr:sugar phosphate isomerase/epimerase family protein [Verrucomicrobiota bacterium]MDP6250796.1 sugar phosphate isomerase/epimerase family protein [Verrucomicrobiota bacterium]
MNETGLEYAELQYLWEKEVGDLNDAEMAKVQTLIEAHNIRVSCISRHNFAGMLVGATEVGDANYNRHMNGLRRCIDMAQELDTTLVRIMSFRREMILFGSSGADHWVTSTGAWDKLLKLLEAPVALAEEKNIKLVLETGNNAMVPSAWLGQKLIDEIGSEHLRILWDPANSLYANEPTYPDGWEALKSDYIGHLHVKDARVNMPRAHVDFCELGSGDMAPYLRPLADEMKRNGHGGFISLESVYRPEDGSFEDGYRASLPKFKELFDW